jgi:site-specific DNA recombinase
MKKVLIYCRVSTSQQDGDEKTSLDTQAAACMKLARERGYEVGRVTKEVFTGAELWDRPLLARDRAAIMAGEFQALIVYALDRLSREQNALGLIACECLRGDCELISVTENLDDSPQGKFLRSAAAFAAELEREKIRERTMRGRKARLDSGKPAFGGWQLYGYQANKHDARYEIVESEAITVRRIFDLSLSGLGCHAIASRLNCEGIPSPKTRFRGPTSKWSAAGIYRMLTNPSYKGEEWGWKTRRQKKRDRARPREEWIALPAGIRPAIVSAEVWSAAQEGLKNKGTAAARNYNRPILLRGMVFCGECGSRMMRNKFERGKYVYDKYRCGSRWRPYQSTCKGAAIEAAAADRWAWAQIQKVFSDPEIITREVRRLEESAPDPELERQLERARGESQRIERGIQGLLATMRRQLSDDVIGPQIEREIRIASREKRTVDDEIGRLEAELAIYQRARVDAASLVQYCKRVVGRLKRLGFEERRMALEALGTRVVGNGDDLRLQIKIPVNPEPDVISLRASADYR